MQPIEGLLKIFILCVYYDHNHPIGIECDIYDKTVQSELCDFILFQSSKSKCEKCIHIRANLSRRIARHKGTSSDIVTSPSSHTNYRLLTRPQLVCRLQSMHDQCQSFHSKVEKLKNHITMMIMSEGVKVDEELHSELQKIMKIEAIKMKFRAGSFQELFWQEQLKTLSHSN